MSSPALVPESHISDRYSGSARAHPPSNLERPSSAPACVRVVPVASLGRADSRHQRETYPAKQLRSTKLVTTWQPMYECAWVGLCVNAGLLT
jgi:hypothetical protein